MHKEIIAKILHDLASPLTSLSLLSHTNNDIQITTDDMIWRLKCLRLIFVKEKLSHTDITPFIKNIHSNTYEDKYNRLFIILAYLFKNTSSSSHYTHHNESNKNISLKIENNILKISAAFSKNDLEILSNDQIKISASNILLKLLKEEINYLNIKIQML